MVQKKVGIREDVHDRLSKYKKAGITYSAIITKLLDIAEKTSCKDKVIARHEIITRKH